MGCCESKEEEQQPSSAKDEKTPSKSEPKLSTLEQPSTAETKIPTSTGSRTEQKPPTPEECVSVFSKTMHIHVDDLIVATEKQLESIENMMQTRGGMREETLTPPWESAVQSGDEIIELLAKCIPNLDKRDVDAARRTVARILEPIEKVHWIVGGLCLVAFVLNQIRQVNANKNEAIKLLRQMIKLARHVRNLRYDIPEERDKFSYAIHTIFEGTILCASQLSSESRLRMFEASVESKRLNELESNINHLYQDLTLTVARKIQHQQSVTPPPLQPSYPDYAVGIEEQQKGVETLLDLTTPKESSWAVVIYGVGGVGKTTLANAVVSRLNLKDYNYTCVEIQEVPHRNDFKRLQEQILNDAFPEYTNGKKLNLRNCTEGREHLKKAFQCPGNKPVFINIDNVLRADDLKELLPKDLHGLPARSRILITARNLSSTDVISQGGFERRTHLVNTLPPQDAKRILIKDPSANLDGIRTEMDSIIKICDGIPLVLEIVGARLHKQEYKRDKCSQIFETLQEGKHVKEDNLTSRLFNFVYQELEEPLQQAFLDICFFFTNWNRHHVESIVGAEEVKLLEEAALVKTSPKNELIVQDIIRAIGLRMSATDRIMNLQLYKEAVQIQRMMQIKGVWLEEDEFELQEEHLSSMKNSLRVLVLGNRVKVRGQPRKASKFEQLRFLRIGGGISSMPVNLESLERLAVYHGPIFKEGVNLYQLPKGLRMIKAAAQSDSDEVSRQSQVLKSMKILQNSSLEELDLQELNSLQKLPVGLDHLKALKILKLDEWDRIQELPEQVCKLSSLVEMKLTRCKALKELPSCFGELESLRDLDLTECIELKKLPASFVNLRSLEVLNLERCWNLEALPSSFGDLRNLMKLSLQSNVLKELPSSFGQLRSLTELKCRCIALGELPASFGELGSLTNLDLKFCAKLATLPSSTEQLCCLQHLNLNACFMLEELPSKIVDLPCLKSLNLGDCSSLKEFRSSSFKKKARNLVIVLPDHLSS